MAAGFVPRSRGFRRISLPPLYDAGFGNPTYDNYSEPNLSAVKDKIEQPKKTTKPNNNYNKTKLTKNGWKVCEIDSDSWS